MAANVTREATLDLVDLPSGMPMTGTEIGRGVNWLGVLPVCFSSGKDQNCLCKDRGAADGVAAAFDGSAGHQMDRAAEAVFEVFLERAHFEEANVVSWEELNQQIDVAAWPAFAAGEGTEKIDPGDAGVLANGADDSADFIHGRGNCSWQCI